MGLVSILMPVKNAEKFISETLDSVLDQSYQEWELIAIDDQSSDHSQAILKNYCEKDSRIQVFENPEVGIIAALQHALSISNGDFITRMDSDDLMPTTRLDKMVSALDQSAENTVVTGLVSYFPKEGLSEGYQTYERWLNEVNLSNREWENVYRECVIASPNWMVRKDELEKIGGFDYLTYPEDYHLVFRWYQNHFNVNVIPETTLLWREHPDRTSRNSDHYNQDAFFQLKIGEFIDHELSTNRLVIWGNNPKTKLTKSILDTHGVPYESMDLSNYKEISEISNPQVLIGVYPPAEERIAIINYLKDLDFQEGKDFWFI